MTTVTFVDTSVLCELLQVPGKSSPAQGAELAEEMDVRQDEGERFVIPVTALIEVGNHIAQCSGDRRAVALRLVKLLEMAVVEGAPWTVLQTRFGSDFLAALRGGDSTGEPLEDLLAKKIGTGDVAILVERDQFRSASSVTTTQVWTLDLGLSAVAQVSP